MARYIVESDKLNSNLIPNTHLDYIEEQGFFGKKKTTEVYINGQLRIYSKASSMADPTYVYRMFEFMNEHYSIAEKGLAAFHSQKIQEYLDGLERMKIKFQLNGIDFEPGYFDSKYKKLTVKRAVLYPSTKHFIIVTNGGKEYGGELSYHEIQAICCAITNSIVNGLLNDNKDSYLCFGGSAGCLYINNDKNLRNIKKISTFDILGY